MNNDRFTLFNSILHALVGMGFSITIGFGNPILASLGLNSSKIGIIFALSMIAGIFIQIGFSYIVENRRIITVIQCIRLEAILSIIIGIIFVIAKNNNILASISFLLALSLSTSGFPTLGALSVECLNAGEKLNFGLSRAMGSIGYSLFGFFGGYLISIVGETFLFYPYILLNVLIVLITFIHPKYVAIDIINETKSDSIISMLTKNNQFRKLILGISLIFFSHNVINNFLKDIISYVNANDIQYGIAVGLSSFLELPTLILFGIIVKRFSNISLLRISAIFMSLKVIIETLSTSFNGIVIAQFTQPLAFALFTPAVIFYMNDIVKRGNQVKAQLMIGVASMGIGGSLGNIIGGLLINTFGIRATLIISSIIAIVGAIIFMFLKDVKYKNNTVYNK